MKIDAQSISILRGEDLVLEGLSFAVQSGEALIVQGPNGTGKSTLLRAVAGLLPLEAGVLSHLDESGEFGEATLPELCHYLGHENAMKAALSVGENLAFWRKFAGQPHCEIDEALEMVGLGGLSSIPFAHLSTGQRRRASIARLLVSYRPVWLLDEPTAGLDAASEQQFSALMQAHLEDDGLILATTHLPLGLQNASVLDLGQMPSGMSA